MSQGPLPSADFSRVDVFIVTSLLVTLQVNGGGAGRGGWTTFTAIADSSMTAVMGFEAVGAAGGISRGYSTAAGAGLTGCSFLAGSLFTGSAAGTEITGDAGEAAGGSAGSSATATTSRSVRTAASGRVNAIATPATTTTAHGVAARRFNDGLSRATRRCSRCDG